MNRLGKRLPNEPELDLLAIMCVIMCAILCAIVIDKLVTMYPSLKRCLDHVFNDADFDVHFE